MIGQAVGMFAVTNVDDLLVLAVFFGRGAGTRDGARGGWGAGPRDGARGGRGARPRH